MNRPRAFTYFVFVLSRIPFIARHLLIRDSVLYAWAMEHFDVTLQRPHPPGNLLYVGVAKGFRMLIPDDNLALVMVSLVSSLLAFMLFEKLLQRALPRSRVMPALLMFATCPLAWFFSGVALPYAGEMMFGLLLATIDVQPRKGAIAAALVLALAGAFRQATLVFLLPLWVWKTRRSMLQKRIAALGLSAVIIGADLALMAGFSGGWSAYRTACRSQWRYLVAPFTPLLGRFQYLDDHLFFTLSAIILGLGGAILPLTVALLSLRRSRNAETSDPDGRITGVGLLVWILPALLFMLLVHAETPAYALIMMPPLLLFAMIRGGRLASARACHFLALVNLFAFCLLPTPPFGRAIRGFDRTMSAIEREIRENFAVEETLLVTRRGYIWQRGFAHAAYYLPEYRVLELAPSLAAGPVHARYQSYQDGEVTMVAERLVPVGIRILLQFDESPPPEPGWQRISLPGGSHLWIYHLERPSLRSIPFHNTVPLHSN